MKEWLLISDGRIQLTGIEAIQKVLQNVKRILMTTL
mgnify:CR=1 FL=1